MTHAQVNLVSVNAEMLEIIEKASSQLTEKISAAFKGPLTLQEIARSQKRLENLKSHFSVNLHPSLESVIDKVLQSLQSRSAAVNDELEIVRLTGVDIYSTIDKAIDAIRHKADEMNVVVPNSVLDAVRSHLKKEHARKFNESKKYIKGWAAEGNACAVSNALDLMETHGAQIGRTVSQRWADKMRGLSSHIGFAEELKAALNWALKTSDGKNDPMTHAEKDSMVKICLSLAGHCAEDARQYGFPNDNPDDAIKFTKQVAKTVKELGV